MRGLIDFATHDGSVIRYRDEGTGRPLLMLHGLMADGSFFREQEPLAQSFRLIRPDLRGHGESVGESASTGGGANVSRLVEDIEALVEHLDLRGAIGVGWSLGATMLFRLLTGAQAHRFAGAVIVDMTARVQNSQDWTLGLSPEACEARTNAIRDDFDAFATDAGERIFASPDLDRARWASERFARSDRGAIAAIWESLVEEDGRGLVARIEVPVLVVHGARSYLYGTDTADHLVAALPDARAHRFEDSGHAPHLEQPLLFNALIEEFAEHLPRQGEVRTAVFEGRET